MGALRRNFARQRKRPGFARGVAESGGTSLPFGLERTRTAAHVLLLLCLSLGLVRTAEAQQPLFAFAQISDSQPETPEHVLRFQQVLDTIVAAGSPGALIPLPIDFVLFPGDLVSDGEDPPAWVEVVQMI